MTSNIAPSGARIPATASIDELRITGLTGVDVGLEIAGPGNRSYAFLIDWQIRIVIALVWVLAALVIKRLLGDDGGAQHSFLYVGGIPALALYLLYHPILEVVMRGRTPGKRRAGLRIVTRSGGTPSIGALLLRNVFRLIDSLPGFYVVGLLCCFVTEQRVRIGDLAAGTVLVVEAQQRLSTATLEAVTRGGLTPAAIELIEELLERWDSLTREHRSTLAHTLLMRVGKAPATSGDNPDFELREQLRHVLALRTAAN